MIYKRLSRGEMLKALKDHATFTHGDDDLTLKWNDDMECYHLDGGGMHMIIDRFSELNGSPNLITTYVTFETMGHEFEIMSGAITAHDWMVELPEEGEQ